MNAMMDSKAVCMGRIICPIMMFMCCILLTIALISSVTVRTELYNLAESNETSATSASNATR